MTKLFISDIYIYPIKSLGGISLKSAQVTDRGLLNDRRWMLVDSNGRFMSQRTMPQMALLRVSMDELFLSVEHKTRNIPPLRIPLSASAGQNITVSIWNDSCRAETVSPLADEWFSRVLDVPCRLVHMAEDSLRPVDTKYASMGEIVSFADAYPFLLIGQASLDDLNSRLSEKLPMNRFRPNIVFSGGRPYEEDTWKEFRAGQVTFYPVKPCSRCAIITTDQNTALVGREPLATLSKYRSQGNMVLFGQNLLHSSTGIIAAGDELEVIYA